MVDMKICSVAQEGDDVILRLEVPELHIEMRDAFSEQIRRAVNLGTGSITFDLYELKRIYSIFLGLILDGVWTAKRLERPVRIILNPDMFKHFTDLGIQNAAELVRQE